MQLFLKAGNPVSVGGEKLPQRLMVRTGMKMVRKRIYAGGGRSKMKHLGEATLNPGGGRAT
jgi:hypothetical protein